MTVPAAACGHDIALVGTHLDEAIVASVAGNGYHPNLKLTLPEAVKAHRWTEFGTIMADSPDLLIIGVSSAGVEWAIDRLAEAMTAPCPVLMITKGMMVTDDGLGALPLHVAGALEERLGFAVPVMAVAGPAIAGEQAAVAVEDVAAGRREQPDVDAVLLGEQAVFLVLEDLEVAHAPAERTDHPELEPQQHQAASCDAGRGRIGGAPHVSRSRGCARSAVRRRTPQATASATSG